MKKGNGILYLPSLKSGGIIEMNHIEKTEADEFVTAYTHKLVISGHNVMDAAINLRADYDSIINGKHIEYYADIIDTLDDVNLNLVALDIIKSLAHTSINGKRGKRAVFVDFKWNIIGIGRTVIGCDLSYVNYSDSRIGELLQSVKDYIEKHTSSEYL